MRRNGILGACALALATFAATDLHANADTNPSPDSDCFLKSKLVSDLPNVAKFQDPNLKNAWGLASLFGQFWVADNGTSVATVYGENGRPFPSETAPLVVHIDGAGGPGTAAPTGIAVNETGDFEIEEGDKKAPCLFLFGSEDGTISCFSPFIDMTRAPVVIDRSDKAAVFKGVAVTSTKSGNFLFAANFRSGFVEKFNRSFHLIEKIRNPDIPAGFAPFNVINVNGHLFVTFAKQDEAKMDDVPGVGLGFLDELNPDGTFLRHVAARGTLNAPWGVAIAPEGFTEFSGALLVGNFGDGKINAFNLTTGAFLGQLTSCSTHRPLVIDGLWGLAFPNPLEGSRERLHFAAGPNDEANGLFGKLVPGSSGP